MLFAAQIVCAADEALRIGLVDEITDDLAGSVDAFADRVASLSSTTQLAAKAIVRRILDGASDDDAGVGSRSSTPPSPAPTFAEGVAAFHTRRPARFI